MAAFFGVILHACGGLAAGSFYVPFRKVRNWAWESYWLVQGVLAWVISPILVAWLTVPHLGEVFSQSSPRAMAWTYLFGLLWGVGGLTFGLSMRYLGLSLGYAVALGFCAAFGTLVPPIFTGRAAELVSTMSGGTVLAGVGVCLLGIGVCGYAGMRKEREVSEEQKKEAVKEFALFKGFLVAVFAGVMSACMAFAITAGKPIAEAAVEAGARPLYQNNPVFVFAMAGGFTTNCLWCLILNWKNRSLGDYVKGPGRRLAGNYFLSGLAGVIWYGQFFFYGMGTTQLGQYDYASWTIHMAFIIVFSNLWGLRFGEWRGSQRLTYRVIFAGLGVLILSTVIIGVGNAISGG